MLPLAARLDQPRDPQQGQMVAHRRLALAESVAKVGYVQFVVLGQVEEDAEPRLVAQELEDLGELADRLLGDLGHRLGRVAIGFARTPAGRHLAWHGHHLEVKGHPRMRHHYAAGAPTISGKRASRTGTATG